MSTNQKNELKALIRKYLKRSCTPQERSELIDYIRMTNGADEMDDLWQEVWLESGEKEVYRELSWEELLNIESQQNQARSGRIRQLVWRWSAAAAVLSGVFFLFQWWTQGEDFMLYETGNGENIEFVLDDGTRINLNANSRLLWNNDWENDGIRKVELEGEAYFEVAHIDAGKSTSEQAAQGKSEALPFEVNTSDLTIRVLGTSFNAIQRRGKTEVFLEEGEVELSLRTSALTPGKEGKDAPEMSTDLTRTGKMAERNDDEPRIVKMLPGEWISYSSAGGELLQKTMVKIEPLMEWKDGTLSYQDVEFRVMLDNLEDIYGKRFEVIDEDLLEKRVNVGVPYKDWDTVTDMMEWMLNIEITEMDENQVRIQRKEEN